MTRAKLVTVLAALLAFTLWAAWRYWPAQATTAAVLLLAATAAPGLLRFALAGNATRRHYPLAWLARLRWRWLARNLGLAYLDHHRKATGLRVPGTTSVPVASEATYRLRYPRARIRPDAYGLLATIRTVPGVGRPELEKSAPYLADAWRCHRVQISQPKPGRLVIRGLRRDPLTEQLPHAGDWAATPPRQLRLGLDEWGNHRALRLGRNTTGVVVGGLPGYGKTSLVNTWLGDLLGTTACQLVVIDGKGGADFTDWASCAWITAGDSLPDAVAALEDAHAEMRKRLAAGTRNAWAAGHPSPAWPLLLVVIDEAATYFDANAYKGDREAEAQARRAVALAAQLIRKGGSACVLVVVLTQRPTADALPTVVRENAALRLCFAVANRDGAAAALGDGIRDYPSYCPTQLQHSDYVGVMVAQLRTGLDPYVRVRVPYLTEDAAAERAAACAQLRQPAPAPVPPGPVPAPSPVPAT